MKNILLIGLGRFGKHVAYQLNELGHEVMRIFWSRLESKIMIFVL